MGTSEGTSFEDVEISTASKHISQTRNRLLWNQSVSMILEGGLCASHSLQMCITLRIVRLNQLSSIKSTQPHCWSSNSFASGITENTISDEKALMAYTVSVDVEMNHLCWVCWATVKCYICRPVVCCIHLVISSSVCSLSLPVREETGCPPLWSFIHDYCLTLGHLFPWFERLSKPVTRCWDRFASFFHCYTNFSTSLLVFAHQYITPAGFRFCLLFLIS